MESAPRSSFSQNADARMRIINSDGSEAEMCGNGIRCLARYFFDRAEGANRRIETIAGVIETAVVSAQPFLVRINVGPPVFLHGAPLFDNADVLTVGNPHAVVFVESAADADLLALGARAPHLNVHAVSASAGALDVRHHERGAGLTQACGTGSAAAAIAAIRRGIARSPVTVRVPGGELLVEWDGTSDAFLTGPAEPVFDATIRS
ncbi:MAG: diaminopimelate epimerase [Candidatus Baltobacteraceae bacterium]